MGSAARHLTLALTLLAAPAWAEERDFCPERPGLNETPCIAGKGRVFVEVSAVDWTLEREPRSRTDTVLIGDTLVRVGLTGRLEAQLGWTAYGHVRTRNGTSVAKTSGAGDVEVALKYGLANPDGEGFSVAVKPFLVLPTGGKAIGDRTWSAGVQFPVNVALTEALSAAATPIIEAKADDDGDGRHLAYGSAAGLGLELSKAVEIEVEAQLTRDREGGGHRTEALGEISVAWKPDKETQFDLGAVAGLNHDSPDFELIAGVARRF